MKRQKLIITASLLIAAGYGSIASAHTQSGSLTLNAGTDIYQVTCSNDGSGAPAKLFYQVKDLAPVVPRIVSTVASKGTLVGTISSDPVDGDANYSTGFSVAGGAGIYLLKVYKNAGTGTETYTAQFHCQTSNGTHTGTAAQLIQNQ